MHIHWLQHVPFENLGYIESWLESRQMTQSVTRFFANDSLPALTSFDGLVVMGGPMGANDDAKFDWMAGEKQFILDCIEAGKPVLGICLGAQLIANVLGAEVTPNKHKEIGWFGITKTAENSAHPIVQYLPEHETVFHWHGDRFAIPEGAVHLFRSIACDNQAFIYKDNVLALQFHVETLAANAEALITNCADDLTLGEYIQTADEIKQSMHYSDGMTSMLETVLDYLFGV